LNVRWNPWPHEPRQAEADKLGAQTHLLKPPEQTRSRTSSSAGGRAGGGRMPSVEGNKVTNGDRCAKLALVVDVARAVWGSTKGSRGRGASSERTGAPGSRGPDEEATPESVVGHIATGTDAINLRSVSGVLRTWMDVSPWPTRSSLTLTGPQASPRHWVR
jgi:hypothetical protein